MGRLNIIPGIDKGAKQRLRQDYMESDLGNQVWFNWLQVLIFTI